MNRLYKKGHIVGMVLGLSLLALTGLIDAANSSIDAVLSKPSLNSTDIAILKGEAQKIENFYNNKKLDDAFVMANADRIKSDSKKLDDIKQKMQKYGAGRAEIDSSYKKVMKTWSEAPAASTINTLLAGGDITRTSTPTPAPATPTAPVAPAAGPTNADKAVLAKLEKQIEELYKNISSATAWVSAQGQTLDVRVNNGAVWCDYYFTNQGALLTDMMKETSFDTIEIYKKDGTSQKLVEAFNKKIEELKKAALNALKEAALEEMKKNDPDTFKYVLAFALAASHIDKDSDQKREAIWIAVSMKDYIEEKIKKFNNPTTTGDEKKLIIYALGKLVADPKQPLQQSDFVVVDGIMSAEQANRAAELGMFVYLSQKLGDEVAKNTEKEVQETYAKYRTTAVIVAESEEKEKAARENKALAQTDVAGFNARVDLVKALLDGKAAGFFWGITTKYPYKSIYKTELPVAVLAAETPDKVETYEEVFKKWTAMSDDDKNKFREKYKIIEAILTAQAKTDALGIMKSDKILNNKQERLQVIYALYALDIPEEDALYFMRARMLEQFTKSPIKDAKSNTHWNMKDFKDSDLYGKNLMNEVKYVYQP